MKSDEYVMCFSKELAYWPKCNDLQIYCSVYSSGRVSMAMLHALGSSQDAFGPMGLVGCL